MKLTQLELEQFVELWQNPVTTVAEIAVRFKITPRKATTIAAGVREELRKQKPPVELLDKRRKITPDYEILARVAREVIA